MEKYLIASHIEAYPFEETKLNIYNRDTGKTFVLGEKESQVFKLMNGANTVEDIQSKCDFYTVEEICKLAQAFKDIGLFDKSKKKFNPLKIKLRLFNPNKFFKEDGLITKVMHYAICVGSPLLMLASLLVMRFANSDPAGHLTKSIETLSAVSVTDIVVLVIGALVFLSLHEFAHMITARRYGVNVPEIGVMLYFLIPCAYTDVSGINLLKSKGQRLMVLLSGSLVNVGLMGLFYMILALTDSASTGAYCIAFIIINFGTIFMNTMVLIKFDGYYILETLLDEPSLRENAMGHLFGFIKIIFSKNKEAKKSLSVIKNDSSAFLQHTAYCVYAVLSMMYVPFIMLNTVVPFVF